MDITIIQKRIAELKEEREKWITQANINIGRLSGAIEELEKLIAPQKEEVQDEVA